MADRWLLVETFGGGEGRDPTVIALGQTAKRMVALKSVLGRGGYIRPVREMIDQVAATGEAFRGMTPDGRRRLIADPLISFAGRVNGVYAWAGRAGEQPPPRAVAGAWYFNRTTRLIGGSDGLLDLYGVAPEDRERQRLTAEAFTRLLPGNDHSAALALLVRAEPGNDEFSIRTNSPLVLKASGQAPDHRDVEVPYLLAQRVPIEPQHRGGLDLIAARGR